MRTILVWRWPVRIMHWSMVIAFFIAMWTRNSELERMIHVDAGYVVAAIILIRVFYGFIVKDQAAFRRFPPSLIKGFKYLIDLVLGRSRNYLGHNPAGAIAIYGMLILGLAVFITGYSGFEYDNDLAKDWHNKLSYLWFYLICFHVFGVMMGSLAHREFLVISMITGYKTRRSINESFSLEAAGMTLLIFLLRVVNFFYLMLSGKGFISSK